MSRLWQPWLEMDPRSESESGCLRTTVDGRVIEVKREESVTPTSNREPSTSKDTNDSSNARPDQYLSSTSFDGERPLVGNRGTLSEESPFSHHHLSTRFKYCELLQSHKVVQTDKGSLSYSESLVNLSLTSGPLRQLSILAGERGFTCAHCSAKLTDEKSLYQHQVVHSGFFCGGISEKREENQDSCEHTGYAPAKDGSYACNVSSPKFQEESHLKMNQIDVGFDIHAFSDKTSSATIHRKSHSLSHTFYEHRDERNLPPFLCPAKFKKNGSLDQHQAVHSSVRDFSRGESSVTFKRKTDLQGHIRNKHTQVRNFSCPQRPAKFTKKGNFKNHQTVHSDVRAYLCGECSKKYKQKSNLLSHIRRKHIQDRNFPCSLCLKKFKTKGELILYQVVHSDVRAYSCGECSAKFKRKSVLLSHMGYKHAQIRHFPCFLCPQKFNTKRDLKQHQVVHSDVRAFSCGECSAKFKEKNNLLKHIRRKHLPESNFPCSLCPQKFKTLQELNQHQLAH